MKEYEPLVWREETFDDKTIDVPANWPKRAEHPRRYTAYFRWAYLGGREACPVDIAEASVKTVVNKSSLKTVSPNAKLSHVLETFWRGDIRLLAVSNGNLAGSIGSAEVRKLWQTLAQTDVPLAEYLKAKRAFDIARRKNIIKVRSDQTLHDALRILNQNRLMAVIVVDDQSKPIGVCNRREVWSELISQLLQKLNPELAPNSNRHLWPGKEGVESTTTNKEESMPDILEKDELLGYALDGLDTYSEAELTALAQQLKQRIGETVRFPKSDLSADECREILKGKVMTWYTKESGKLPLVAMAMRDIELSFLKKNLQ